MKTTAPSVPGLNRNFNLPARMKIKMKVFNALAAFACALSLAAAAEISVQSLPPVVVKTAPEAGALDVDPATSEIRVTFSKEMKTDRMWSVVQISKETFPEIAGDIRYLGDKRTCVIPVKLEPGRTYVLWFNRAQFNSFRDTRNNPSVPYMLVFQTK